MPLSNTRELKEDVLFRASESLTGSAWDDKVIDYLNRVYRTLCAGASEFLPEYVEDWWWMRASGVLLLEPVIQAGFVTVENGSQTIIFSVPPGVDCTGRRIRIQGHPDVFVIQSHAEDVANAVLDAPWTGDSNATSVYQVMRTEYTIDAAAQVVSSPMIAFRNPHRINGITPEKMDEIYPLVALSPGMPEAFCLEDERVVRFSHGGRDDERTMRVEYRYRPEAPDLTDSTLSVPLVPAQWMHVLADMALTYVLLDKNDDRSNAAALGARTGLAAMLKENRRRLTKIDHMAGQIVTRPNGGGIASGPRTGRI